MQNIPREFSTPDETPSPSVMAARMKLLFVGDNRSTVNWGRGASIALSQLLSDSFEITGRVNGDFFELTTAEAGYVGTFTPAKYYRLFQYSLLRKRRRPFAWYIKLEQLFGAKDFIAEDPVASIDNLLAHMHRNPALARIYEQAMEADLLVLDGDGDIIFFNFAPQADSLPTRNDRTWHSPKEACLSREFNDFRLSVDRKK